jgi:hypothetical protein
MFLQDFGVIAAPRKKVKIPNPIQDSSNQRRHDSCGTYVGRDNFVTVENCLEVSRKPRNHHDKDVADDVDKSKWVDKRLAPLRT